MKQTEKLIIFMDKWPLTGFLILILAMGCAYVLTFVLTVLAAFYSMFQWAVHGLKKLFGERHG